MRRRNLIALGLLALVILVLLALQTPLLRRVRGAAWNVWVQTVGDVFRLGPLGVDNDVLGQLQRLQADNVRLRAQQHEYQQLKEQLGSATYESLRAIPAEVAARPLDTFRLQFVINRGAKEGVTLNAPVVVYGSTLIGFVSELHQHTAIMQLLLHPATSLAAEVVAESNAKGLVVSRQYTSLVFTTVPRDAALQSGQEVVTRSRTGLPGGLLIGRLESIQREENQAYQTGSLAIPYDPDHIRAVTVLVEP